jgi:hypothetical protein
MTLYPRHPLTLRSLFVRAFASRQNSSASSVNPENDLLFPAREFNTDAFPGNVAVYLSALLRGALWLLAAAVFAFGMIHYTKMLLETTIR